jgi:hypothetical protein
MAEVHLNLPLLSRPLPSPMPTWPRTLFDTGPKVASPNTASQFSQEQEKSVAEVALS